MADFPHTLKQMLVSQDCIALAIHEIALFVQYIVIVEQVFSDFEVSVFNPLLGFLYGIGEHSMLDRLPVLHSDFPKDVLQVLRSEESHQGVVKRYKEAAGTGVPLSAASSSELVVDTS